MLLYEYMPKLKILIVEDNRDMREAVKAYLQDKGYLVYAVDSAESALKSPYQHQADITLVDISLPGMSGLEYTNKIKNEGYAGPIIGITARDSVDDRVNGLGTGMSDYIVKPFDLRELDARINAQLRNRDIFQDQASITTQNFKIIPKTHQFLVRDKLVKLTLLEYRIMLRLMQNNHGIVTTQDIIEFAWGEEASTTTPPIRIHISNLRSKIADEQLTTIQTVPGIGYMLQD